ncbi:alpha/beta hydrolase [Conexibacter stalactiti]|uniref:Alpha/beta hydrolase n=1 Tax=Conexibacter stalactiti TaxID=1940611 RepID=A0ABU4HXU6_9ACTN|nr:alpha/beta hydrolase [Conexibacter stalactiti]MDW5598150.1 alpha/beta hydrolase [Conexibacter stalactiti]MEC5038792.1 alpha/beta hydrolase [Conexibacter stalactiti]
MRALAALVLASLALALVAASARAATPDPMASGPYAVETLDPFRGGTVNLQEPSSTGGAPAAGAAAVTLELRGSLYRPTNSPAPSPVIVLVHGNHAQCDSGSSPFCDVFKRNDRGYAYLGANLASHGYTVLSLDQDQLMYFQDGQTAGMHQRRLLIGAALDMLTNANAAPLPDSATSNIGGRLVGRLDMNRVGLMGHSRGGDAVTSFINWNRTRPEPGRRYNLRGVISLASVDYERSTPWGVPYLSIAPMCDGDVSNLQVARHFERSQYALPGDPFPRIQQSVHGANHNWFNSVWFADGDDSGTADVACGPRDATSIRLSGGLYDRTTRGDADPALMGDQEKIGLATMSSFFRRYVGGEVAFDSYMTGELSTIGDGKQIPESACPTSPNGTRIACAERVMTSYFPGAAERRDVIQPDPDSPLVASALGTALTASGFANPYTADGGVQPQPATTASGLDWCNPEPDHFAPVNLGAVRGTLPTAKKGCPLPAAGALGGQTAAREQAPVNRSYGLQIAAAWDNPIARSGRIASLATRIPAASGDVSGFKALSLGAAVNFFDTRNPARVGDALFNPATLTQDFTIALTDAAGREAAVSAASSRYGSALHPTVGNITPRVHIILNQIRVPLSDFAAQGVDLTKVRKLELRFGEPGKPATGSVQLADVRFQEAVGGPTALTDGGGSAAGVQPIDLIETTARTTVAKAGQAVSLTPTASVTGTCLDTIAPTARITVKGKKVVRGVAADTGCGAKVASVQVTVAKSAGNGKFRYLTPKGAFTKALKPIGARALVAKGATKWTVKLGTLPKGSYRISVRAIDAGGNARTAVKAAKLVVR